MWKTGDGKLIYTLWEECILDTLWIIQSHTPAKSCTWYDHTHYKVPLLEKLHNEMWQYWGDMTDNLQQQTAANYDSWLKKQLFSTFMMEFPQFYSNAFERFYLSFALNFIPANPEPKISCDKVQWH